MRLLGGDCSSLIIPSDVLRLFHGADNSYIGGHRTRQTSGIFMPEIRVSSDFMSGVGEYNTFGK